MTSERPKKVLFLTNVPSPYRVDFFNELGKHCDLTVLFERKSSSERDDSWNDFKTKNFSAVFLNGKSFHADSAFCPSIVRYLKKDEYDHIIVTNFSSPTGILAIAHMKSHHIPYEIESDGGFAKSGKGIKERLKKWLISGATRWFSTAKEHDKYYLQYGAKKEGIVRYSFTSLHQCDVLEKCQTAEAKSVLRKKIGMTERLIVISVGQFIYRKGFDLLIQAGNQLSKEVGIYIVGGTPTQEYVDLASACVGASVHFVNFMAKRELFEYMQAADLFALPTREDIWGLVINEAMANGLPVVTTNRCIAGLELVENGVNGYIVPVDSVNELAEAIQSSLEQCDSMGAMSLEKIGNYTIEDMANEHV